MVKKQKGYRWVKLTESQYQKCVDMSEPEIRNGRNQFEAPSFVAGWCVDQMMIIPPTLPKRYAAASFEVQKHILDLLKV
jgi:hypothetical protein